MALVGFFLDSHENGTLTFSLKKTAPKLNDGKKHMHAIIIYN